MEYTGEELAEAKRQIDSTLHKLKEVIKTLEAKEDPGRYKAQITLARRRVAAFALAGELVERELENIEHEKENIKDEYREVE